MPLTDKTLNETCKMGQGHECCRYIIVDPAIGITCAKFTDLKPLLDQRAEEGQMIARGDNCDGFKEQ